jgi:mannosylglucosylglycerate synthase
MMTRTIAIAHYAGPPGIGGVEVTMAAHAHVMVRAGYRVRIVAGSGADVIPGAETFIIPALSSRGPLVDAVNRDLQRGYIGAEFEEQVVAIERELDRALAGVDVLVVHNVHTLHKNLAFTEALYRRAVAGRGPYTLAWCHDFAWSDPLYADDVHAGAPWDRLRTVWPHTRYVVVSEDRRAMLADLLGMSPRDIAVVTPGVDPVALFKLEPSIADLVQRYDLLDAAPLFLLPARITRRKNIEQAIAIVGAMRAQGASPRLLVTGPPGPHNPTNAAYLAALEDLRAASGAEDAVIFLYRALQQDGAPMPVSDAMMADLYKLADALLFPSRVEGFGIPIVEAGLAGVPIFCSDITPFRETAGDAATYFDLEGDPALIAAHILTELHADRRWQFRRKVRASYTWLALFRRHIEPLLVEAGAHEESEQDDR